MFFLQRREADSPRRSMTVLCPIGRYQICLSHWCSLFYLFFLWLTKCLDCIFSTDYMQLFLIWLLMTTVGVFKSKKHDFVALMFTFKRLGQISGCVPNPVTYLQQSRSVFYVTIYQFIERWNKCESYIQQKQACTKHWIIFCVQVAQHWMLQLSDLIVHSPL